MKKTNLKAAVSSSYMDMVWRRVWEDEEGNLFVKYNNEFIPVNENMPIVED